MSQFIIVMFCVIIGTVLFTIFVDLFRGNKDE